ncbi:MAG: ester cyclase [Acidimicrobiia bacterium]|nr:ester cyclase [Acidimicrobiia bacterium]
MTDRLDPLASGWAEAWNAHDLDAVMALYAPDATHRMSSGPLRRGSDEIAAMVRRSLDAFPDLSFTVRDAFATSDVGGGRVVIEYTMRGTQSGVINGRAGSARPIEVDGALVATLDGSGRLLVVVDYIDHHAIRRQQGSAP